MLQAQGLSVEVGGRLVVESADLHQLATDVLEARKKAEPELFARLFTEDAP